MTNTQELARRFNEDEAIWQSYESSRKMRLRDETLLADEILDELDWIEAERECRQIRLVGTRVIEPAGLEHQH